MVNYTYVSDTILKDLVSAKSKVTDMRVFVNEHAELLRIAGLLDEITAILDGAVYRDEGVEDGKTQNVGR